MPTDATVLVFSNRWYPAAIDRAETFHIAGHNVRVVTPALFIATKLEAFHERGGNDVFASHDIEDIIAVVPGGEGLTADPLPRSTPHRPSRSRSASASLNCSLISQGALHAMPWTTSTPLRGRAMRRV